MQDRDFIYSNGILSLTFCKMVFTNSVLAGRFILYRFGRKISDVSVIERNWLTKFKMLFKIILSDEYTLLYVRKDFLLR